MATRQAQPTTFSSLPATRESAFRIPRFLKAFSPCLPFFFFVLSFLLSIASPPRHAGASSAAAVLHATHHPIPSPLSPHPFIEILQPRGRNVDQTGTASSEIALACFDSSSFSVFLVKDAYAFVERKTSTVNDRAVHSTGPRTIRCRSKPFSGLIVYAASFQTISIKMFVGSYKTRPRFCLVACACCNNA